MKLNGEEYDPKDHEGQVWGRRSEPDDLGGSRLRARNIDDGDEHKKNIFQRASDRLFDHQFGDKDNPSRELSENERRAITRDAAKNLGGIKGAFIAKGRMPLVAVEKAGKDGTPEFKNAVLGAQQNRVSRINRGFFKRNFIPTAVIGVIITAVGIMMGGTQSLMPFSLVAQLKGQFDTIGVSTNFRSRTFLKLQLDGGRVKNCTKSTIFGGTKFDLSKRNRQVAGYSSFDDYHYFACCRQFGRIARDDFGGSGLCCHQSDRHLYLRHYNVKS